MDTLTTETDGILSTNTMGSMEISKTDLKSSIASKKLHIEHEDLRKIYTTKYGVTMEFPSCYRHSAKIVPHKPDYIVSTAFHIIPKSFE